MIAIIMAGGGGARLWPFSRAISPKQFLNLGSTHESLLQETIQRVSPFISKENIYISASVVHKYELTHQVRQSLPDFPLENLLLEPESRNTAPAILWGISKIPVEREDEPVIILPSDHLIKNADNFFERIKQGEEPAKKGWIVTFGIKPDRPEVDFGYIKPGKKLGAVCQTDKFVEKPNVGEAEEFVKSGQYYWNIGVFMATPKTLSEQYQKFCPYIYNAFYGDNGATEHNDKDIKNFFKKVPSESFERAILEKSDKVAVAPVDIDWNYIKNWENIYRENTKDENGNVIRGNVILQDTQNSLIFSEKRLVSCVGLKDIIIVETDDALLACDLKRSQDVKALVEALKRENRFEYKFHRTVVRAWGSYTVLHEGEGYQIKKLVIDIGKSISLQRHFHRSEHWIVVSGVAEVTKDKETFHMVENESTYIPKLARHSLKNPGKYPLEIIEAQQGDYLGEDDIERFTEYEI